MPTNKIRIIQSCSETDPIYGGCGEVLLRGAEYVINVDVMGFMVDPISPEEATWLVNTGKAEYAS